MLRVVKPRSPLRRADVVVDPIAPSEPPPFGRELPDDTDMRAGVELTLVPFDEPTENTPVTVQSPWQRFAPPPLPQSEDG